jgi:hypothetical protein
MPDKIRNAIVDLTAQIVWIEENEYHKFPGWQNVTDAMREAVALLKEQEAVKPKKIDRKRNHFIKCGRCNYDLMAGFQFCPHCGKAVKWNDY